MNISVENQMFDGDDMYIITGLSKDMDEKEFLECAAAVIQYYGRYIFSREDSLAIAKHIYDIRNNTDEKTKFICNSYSFVYGEHGYYLMFRMSNPFEKDEYSVYEINYSGLNDWYMPYDAEFKQINTIKEGNK